MLVPPLKSANLQLKCWKHKTIRHRVLIKWTKLDPRYLGLCLVQPNVQKSVKLSQQQSYRTKLYHCNNLKVRKVKQDKYTMDPV